MKVDTPKINKIFCGDVCKLNPNPSLYKNILHKQINDILPNMFVNYKKFVKAPYLIPPQIIDLLQIASYIFTADRLISRGERKSINNNSWARSFDFQIPVYNVDFWNDSKIKVALSNALEFMTGDRKYDFSFYPISSNVISDGYEQMILFGEEYETIEDAINTDVMLFSGGLDSLTGAIQHLNDNPQRKLCLVSHISNKGTSHTQSILVKYLSEKFPLHIKHYGFECHLRKISSVDETQRTRMFLFSAIAFAICYCYNKHELYIYENGVTSINLPKQGDVMRARASRTTHPKTLGLLQIFYKLFDESFEIKTPYYNKTKAEILQIFSSYPEKDIFTSSVSCSKTRTPQENATHCGCCSQCIDRRFAIYAAGLDDNKANYVKDFIIDKNDKDTEHRLINTMRLACMEEMKTTGDFLEKYANEINDLLEFWPGTNPEDKLTEIYQLMSAYGKSIIKASHSMRLNYEDLSLNIEENTFFKILSSREYLKTPYELRVKEIENIISKAIPLVFQKNPPDNENDFNDKVSGILNSHEKFEREYPTILFGLTSIVPDHSQDSLVIESKYIRNKSMTKSKATEDISADIYKIPNDYGILFIIYDPNRIIKDDESFINPFESKRSNCFVRIFR